MFDLFKRKNKTQGDEKRDIVYITDKADWVIKCIGGSLSENIEKKHGAHIEVRGDFSGLKNKVIHFGARNLYLPHNFLKVHKSNKVVFTWFHGTEQDTNFIEALPRASKYADLIHTSSTISANRLKEWGADENKIRIIPLGIDTHLFKPVSTEEKNNIRKSLGIPEKFVLIGSFQKDGNGWEEGETPKLIKGPDIFCDAVSELAKGFPVFVLLTGPARGYVKKRLSESGVPFKHFYPKNYEEIARYYNALDLYIVSSRTEGGPMAILESMASGVPLVSTKVGMAPDIIKHGINGFLADIEKIGKLRGGENIKDCGMIENDKKNEDNIRIENERKTENTATNEIEKLSCNYNMGDIVSLSAKILSNPGLQESLIKSGLATASNFTWEIISEKYWNEFYSVLR